jgi:hypothetical protein
VTLKPQFIRSPGAVSHRCVSQGGRGAGGQKRARDRHSVVGTSEGAVTRNVARPLVKRQKSLSKLECGDLSVLPVDVRASHPVEGSSWQRHARPLAST